MIRLLALLAVLVALALPASAHEVRPAYLALEETQPDHWQVTWKQPVLAGKRLRMEPVFRTSSHGEIIPCPWTAETRENLSASTIERGPLTCAIDEIAIPGLERTLTDVIVEIRKQGEETETFIVRPDAPQVDLSEPAQSAAGAYFAIGIEHILFGWDHLLFVIGLVLLIERKRRLLGVVTAFTLAHSLTLGMAALGVVGIPGRPVEILIAASIILLAIEVLSKRKRDDSLALRYPYLIAIAIGLVHGLGFAGALSEIGLPEGSELLALLMFNLGVEFGQVAVILLMLLTLGTLARFRVKWLPRLEHVLAYSLGCIGMFWVIDRLSQYFA